VRCVYIGYPVETGQTQQLNCAECLFRAPDPTQPVELSWVELSWVGRSEPDRPNSTQPVELSWVGSGGLNRPWEWVGPAKTKAWVAKLLRRTRGTACQLMRLADHRWWRPSCSERRVLNIILLFVQCYAWTEYKFTCVCVSVTLSVNSPTGQTPQRIFSVDSLKDTIYARMCLLGVSMMNNHI